MPHKNNEDIWGHTENTVWVFDGATGLSPDKLVANGDMTDPRWLVECADRSLKAHADDIADIQRLYARVLADCETAFHAEKKRDANAPYELPMAASLIVQYNGTIAICGSLSDCSMIIETEDGLKTVAPCPKHAVIDSGSKAKMQDVLKKGMTIDEARANLIPHLQENRKLANCDDGYDVFAPETMLYERIRIETFTPAANGHALLMTDGFYALVENYAVYNDAELITAAKEIGLSALYAELRDIEDSDSNALKYPRMKKSDDATAVLVRF